ncbi:MAG: hypothetical protein HYS12_20900 [Planctomycetes bacterium]|nr:hypothetical protein [Planctomycetota bacterium]
MAAGEPDVLATAVVVHRIGGGNPENLRLKAKEETLTPPGISVLLGGTPAEAAEQMRHAFPDPRKFRQLHNRAQIVGSATVEEIRQAGFEIVPDPSPRFPNHARLIHRDGVAGFSEAARQALSEVFHNTDTPGGGL